MIQFEVNITPMGAVRMTQRSKWKNQSAQNYLRYKNIIGLSARKQFAEPLGGPIATEIEFYYPVPKRFNKKEKSEAIAGTRFPTVKPDIDNCVKGIFDSLNKIAWEDDNRVVALITRKYYSTNPRIVIKVWEVEGA
jgi:Holliday junction resolvase RusA-like endonuclease